MSSAGNRGNRLCRVDRHRVTLCQSCSLGKARSEEWSVVEAFGDGGDRGQRSAEVPPRARDRPADDDARRPERAHPRLDELRDVGAQRRKRSGCAGVTRVGARGDLGGAGAAVEACADRATRDRVLDRRAAKRNDVQLSIRRDAFTRAHDLAIGEKRRSDTGAERDADRPVMTPRGAGARFAEQKRLRVVEEPNAESISLQQLARARLSGRRRRGLRACRGREPCRCRSRSRTVRGPRHRPGSRP